MEKILVYRDEGSTVVLEASGVEAKRQAFNSRNMAAWDEYLGAYDLERGMWIWEGTVSEDRARWIGKWRRISIDETVKIAKGEKVL